MKKFINWLIKRHNKKVDKEWNNYRFLVDLCLEGRTLNLDKYNRLIKMVKKKYR